MCVCVQVHLALLGTKMAISKIFVRTFFLSHEETFSIFFYNLIGAILVVAIAYTSEPVWSSILWDYKLYLNV